MLWTRSLNLKVNAERQYAVPDPDLDFFRPFGPQFSQRIGGAGGGGRTPPLYPPLIQRKQFENNKVKKMKMTPEN